MCAQIFFVGKERWLNISCDEHYYLSESDKNDPAIAPEIITVPFYVITEPLHQLLLDLASQYHTYLGILHIEDYPWCPGPSASCLGDVSIVESIFQFS